MIGQGVIPEGRDQRADAVDPRELGAALDRLRSQIASEVRRLPGHREALARLERR
jgi:tryptophan halogenase